MADFPQIIPIKQENDGVAKFHHPHLPDVGVGVKGGLYGHLYCREQDV